MTSIKAMLQGLTLEDLREWAGSRIFNRGKEYVGCVSHLSRTEDGNLVAWVSGTDEYATSVRHEGRGKFDYACTCPYDDWGPCKHVVAVLLAAAQQLQRDEDIPLIDPDDDLYLEVFEDDDEWPEEEEVSRSGNSAVEPPKGRSPQIEAMLTGKTRDELQALLVELALDFPEVARRLRDSARLETGQVEQLVRSLRKEIRHLTSEDPWYNPWKGTGNLPDYSHVEQQLQALLAKGHADAVFELGEELWGRGVRQVEGSHDEGETALAIASCLQVVLRALPQTSLTPLEQLLWRVEHELDDEYSLLDGTDAVLNDPHYTQEHWRGAAAVLGEWLEKHEVPKSVSFSATYKREKIMSWLHIAYSRSDQEQKIIPLLEQEADRCRSYDHLVKTLLAKGQHEQARQWCIRGFKKTIEDSPGIAAGLQVRLRELAEAEGRFELAAAYLAEDFFDRPATNTYDDLCRAAEKVNAWPAVRSGVLHYLSTGRRPAPGPQGKSSWPLPEPEVKKPESRDKFRLVGFPYREMLIEIALLEKRYDDAVSMYQDLFKAKRWGWSIDERLADAVVTSHPEVALQIWLSIAERLIGQVKPKAYQEAAVYLRQMHRVYEKTGRLAEWKTLLMRLRTQHKAKRRLMEVLDDLETNRKLIH